MPRLPVLELKDLASEQSELFSELESTYGALPSSFLTLGRAPAVLEAAARLSIAVMREGVVDPALKWMVAHIASRAAGCSYCSAHTGFHASQTTGVEAKKMEAIWSFETSSLFSESERAALRVARGAAMVPNAVTDAEFEELRKHYNDDEVAELIAAASLFGFFNRWNDTLSTDLESAPGAFAERHLAPSGWSRK